MASAFTASIQTPLFSFRPHQFQSCSTSKFLHSVAVPSAFSASIQTPLFSFLPHKFQSCSTSKSLHSVAVTSAFNSSIQTRKTLKSRLREGENLYGLFHFSFAVELAEIAAHSGYDFIIVDLEHGAGGIREALNSIRAIEAAGCSAVVRVPEISHVWAEKVLDLGPDGIMFPMVETGRSASDAVSCCRYRPDGVRGCAHSFVRDSKFGFDEAYLSEYADKLLVMCQIESEEGVKNVNEIVAVDGVDCVMMGPRDLSASLGLLHDPGNPKVKSAMRTAEKAVLASDPLNGGAYLAGMATAQDKALDLWSRGYHVVLGSGDIPLFKKAVVDDVKANKKAVDHVKANKKTVVENVKAINMAVVDDVKANKKAVVYEVMANEKAVV